MVNKLNDLVKEIKKIAQEIPKFEGNLFGGPSKPTYSAPSGGHYIASTGNAEIKRMQDAMVNLSKVVMRDATSQGMYGRKQKDMKYNEADPNTVKYKKAFNDFIAEQYAGNLPDDFKGVEWSQDPTVQSKPDKITGQTDLYELNAVLNTLRRIGSPGAGEKEFKSDGFWQFRTNNALQNMMGLAYSLLQMEGDFGIPSTAFTTQDLAAMKKLLSGYEIDGDNVKLSAADKSSRATQLTTLLNKISRLYMEFMEKITSRPSFRPLLEGKRGFDKYNNKGNNPDILNEQDQKFLQSNTTIGNVKINGYRDNKPYVISEIPLSVLKDKTSFSTFLKQIGWNDQQINSQAINAANDIAKQLDTMTESKDLEYRAIKDRK